MANEKRLIDLDEAIDALGVEYKDIYCKHFLEERPTVDAVEVVRCKDCKQFNHQKALRPGGIWCEYWGTDPDPDDFCSYGERRTEDG